MAGLMEVPSELAELKQWMVWRYIDGRKVPFTSAGDRGKSNDSDCWDTAENCLLSNTPKDGIAFVFSKDDPFCGVDLDDCITEGVYEPWVYEILERFKGLAYCEVSPSRTGVKLTTRGKKPDGSRCSNNGGIECYDKLRFWTWTGLCIGDGYETIGDGQSAIDWLIATHLKGDGKRDSGQKRFTTPSKPASYDLVFRAGEYLDKISPSRKGGLRNAAFKLSGHLHSMVGEFGERLSDEQVYQFLQKWNGRNIDQLRDDELREATVNGRKNGTPPADKPPKPKEDYGVDISAICHPPSQEDKDTEESSDDVPVSPGDFPRNAIPEDGIIGMVVELNLRSAMYPQPELAFAAALSLMGAITGRRVESEHRTRTNVYILGLGESGSGKEHGRKLNKILLNQCGPDLIGPERIGSHAGLTVSLKEKLACLFQLDEIDRLLETMKNPGKAAHLYNIATVLMQVYSSSDAIWIGDAYADTKKTPRIEQPHAVVYGTCTPDRFWESITAESVANGLLGRMMVFESKGLTPYKQPAKIDPSKQLIDAITWWANLLPGGLGWAKPVPIVAEHSSDALERYEGHLMGICERQCVDGKKSALWSRAGEKTAKLALLFACSRQQFSTTIRISLDDVERAIRVSNWLTRRMISQAFSYVATNAVEEAKKRVLRLISEAGKSGISGTQLCRKTQWLRPKEREEIVSDLSRCMLIESSETATSGRPRLVFRRKEKGLNT